MNPIDHLHTILIKGRDMGASDIHVGPGERPAFRIDGDIQFQEGLPIFKYTEFEDILKRVLSEGQIRRLADGYEVDTHYEIKGDRFRLNAYRCAEGVVFAFRPVLKGAPSFSDLGLPDVLQEWIQKKSGLIVIAGPTGSGKTTTRSALISEINANYKKHIIIAEDVIERLHPDKQSIIHQRQVGLDGHTRSYRQALVSAMRQDPDVISVGDIRDKDTAEVALSAAQTGHLIIAEIHASTSADALGRITSFFSGTDQLNAREQLAQVFIGAIAQRREYNEKRIHKLFFELLIANTAVRTAIRQNNLESIADAVLQNQKHGGTAFKR